MNASGRTVNSSRASSLSNPSGSRPTYFSAPAVSNCTSESRGSAAKKPSGNGPSRNAAGHPQAVPA